MIKYSDAAYNDILELTILDKEIFGINAYSKDFFVYLMDNSDFFKVVRENDRIIGYICGETLFHRGHLISLAVKKDYRRKGIGTYLLKLFIGFLRKRNIDTMYLEVSVNNHDAIKFYLKRGFRIISRIKRYYANEADAYVMMMNIV